MRSPGSWRRRTLAIYSGRYLAQGGTSAMLEGDWTPQRLIILEFSDAPRARERLETPEAAPAHALRHCPAHTNRMLVEGVAGMRGP